MSRCDGSSGSRASRMEIKDDEDAEFVKSFLNHRSVKSVRVYPERILKSKKKLGALFNIWMDENNISYQSDREKMRRFEGFKERVRYISDNNQKLNASCLCVSRFAAHLPSDPWPGANMTEEEAERYKLSDEDDDELEEDVCCG